MTAIAVSVVTFFATALGGLFAIHQRKRLNVMMAFSAGVLISAALLDLLPEAINLSEEAGKSTTEATLLSAAVGFLIFYGLERFVHMTAAGHEHGSRFGAVAALGLSTHSFLDGLAIGVAYRANPGLGLIVGIAVIAHDFADGVSTVTLVLRSRSDLRSPVGWLLVDALAPIVGAGAAQVVYIPSGSIANLLGFFAGSFLFIGGSHLLPESHQQDHEPTLMIAFVTGFVFLFAITHFAA